VFKTGLKTTEKPEYQGIVISYDSVDRYKVEYVINSKFWEIPIVCDITIDKTKYGDTIKITRLETSI